MLQVKEENVEGVGCERMDMDGESSLKCEPVFSEDSAEGCKQKLISVSNIQSNYKTSDVTAVTQIFVNETECDDQTHNVEAMLEAPKHRQSRK